MVETLTAAEPSPEPAPEPQAVPGRIWTALAAVAVVVSVLANAAMAWGARLTFTYDEVDTLLLGRVALGMPTPHVDGAGYFPGWGLVTAPVWWVTDNPFTFFRIAIILGVVLAAVTIWPLARIATRFGLTTAQGVVAAAIVMTLPARTVQSAFALSEKLVFLMVALTVLAAYRLWERPTYLRGALFSLAAAGAFFTHARMAVLVAVAAVWLVAFALRSWKIAISSLVVLIGASGVAYELAKHWNSGLVPHGFKQEGHVKRNLLDLHLGLLARTMVGEAWLQLLASFGIVALGVVVVLVLVGRDLRQLRLGPIVLVLVTAVGLYLASSLDWADVKDLHAPVAQQQRLDVWLYGRYADPFAMIVTLIGLTAAIKGVERVKLAFAWVLAALVAIPAVVWLAKDVPTWGSVSPAQIAGITPYWWALPHHPFPAGLMPSLTNGNRVWVIATLVSIVPLLAASVVRRRGLAIALVVLLLAGAGSVSARHEIAKFRVKRDRMPPAIATLRHDLATHPGVGVSHAGWDPSCTAGKSAISAQRNYIQWWLLPAIVHKGERPTDGIVISCRSTTPGPVTGPATTVPLGAFGQALVSLPPS